MNCRADTPPVSPKHIDIEAAETGARRDGQDVQVRPGSPSDKEAQHDRPDR